MYLWDTFVSYEYSLWVGCALLYLLDHVKLFNSDELLYQETLWGAWSFRLNKIPFTLFNKELYVLNPFFPWLCAFKAVWGQDFFPAVKAVRSERRDLMAFLKSSSELRLVSLLSFIAMFVLGPVLTATRGLTHAVVTVVCVNVLLQLFTITAVWFRHNDLKVSRCKSILLACEGLICPPYTACLLKRISLNYVIACDGLAVAKALHGAKNFPVVLEHAANRIHEPLGVGLLTEGREASTESYITKLRSS